MDKYLFHNEDSSKHFGYLKERAVTYINYQLTPEYIKSTDESQVVDSVYEFWKAKSLVLLKDKIGQPTVNHKERAVEINIPYTGDLNFFNIRPSSLTKVNPIKGKIDQCIVDRQLEQFVTISIYESDNIENVLDNIDNHINDISKQCADFNIEFKQFIETNVKKRHKEIIDLENKANELDNILRKR